MLNRGLTVAFCPPSASGVAASADANRDANTDIAAEAQGRDLLRAVDFYAAVLAMASRDLRQPLQVIVSAHRLLARRLAAGAEREYLKRSEQASKQLAETLDQLVEALQLQYPASRIEPQPVRLAPILERIGLQLNGRHGARGSSFALSGPAR